MKIFNLYTRLAQIYKKKWIFCASNGHLFFKSFISRFYTIRGMRVMIDRDLAYIYQVETKVLNQAVRRNLQRFPNDFMFQLDPVELENWKSQFVTSKKVVMGLRKKPLVFTEQGEDQEKKILLIPDYLKSFEQIKQEESINASRRIGYRIGNKQNKPKE